MKKIIPFFLFIPLLLFVLLIVISQYKKTPTSSEDVSQPTTSGTNSDVVPTTSTNLSEASVSDINLVINSPESGITVTSTAISINGTTGKNINVVVNDQDLVSNSDGSFSTSVLLDEGENYISIVAYDDFGNSAEREIMVTRTVEGL